MRQTVHLPISCLKYRDFWIEIYLYPDVYSYYENSMSIRKWTYLKILIHTINMEQMIFCGENNQILKPSLSTKINIVCDIIMT